MQIRFSCTLGHHVINGLPPSPRDWISIYRRHHRGHQSSLRVIETLYRTIARDRPFRMRELATRSRASLTTVHRVVGRLRALGVLWVEGGGVVPGKGKRPFSYHPRWPPEPPEPKAGDPT